MRYIIILVILSSACTNPAGPTNPEAKIIKKEIRVEHRQLTWEGRP